KVRNGRRGVPSRPSRPPRSLLCSQRLPCFDLHALISIAPAEMQVALIFGADLALLRGDFRALLAGFRKADGDGLFAARDFLAGTSALQRAFLHFAHFGLDLLAGGLAILAPGRALFCG